MDGFAQTRQPDDLFDDDFTPISESPRPPAQQSHPQRPRAPLKAPSQKAQQPPAQPQPTSDSAPTDANLPPTTSEQASKSTLAVRGDRSATGGINKPKLTEDELSARLAAAKLNNAKREEAHRLAEADEASFQQREAQAQQKRREEGAARRAMDQEREKNRLRKLAVKGGREWDEGKEEQDTRTERGSQFRRGAYGGVAHQVRENGDSAERTFTRGRDRARGRGDRGHGGRGAKGQGAQVNGNQESPAVQREEDFPTLPATKASSKQTGPEQSSEPLTLPTGEKQSWADQVEKAELVEAGE